MQENKQHKIEIILDRLPALGLFVENHMSLSRFDAGGYCKHENLFIC